MGKKGRAKTKAKKAAKAGAKRAGKKIGIKTASKIAKTAEKKGLDVKSLATSLLSGVPIVGPLVADVAEQLIPEAVLGAEPMAPTVGRRGGARGVQLIDASTGLNLGTISRKRALSVLIRRAKFRRAAKKIVLVPSGSEVKVI